jgi:hypothetical protein
MLQRICWNSNEWRGPTGEGYSKEDSYVGKNGFGHEEWNFNTADLINGKVYGYAYYRPNEGTPQFKSRHDIYFFGIRPKKERRLVGFYENARFLSERERARLKFAFQKSDLLEKRVDELLSLDLPTIRTRKRAEEYLLDQYSLNIEVSPEDVHLIVPPRSLTLAHTGGRDPKFLSRYTKPIFLSNAPIIGPGEQQSTRKGGGKGPGTEDDLLEDEYLRFTKAQRNVIRRVHNQLSNRFRAWLKSVGATKVTGESSSVDVICDFGGAKYLFELKVCFRAKSRHALREAIGQILEYRYYPGRPAADHLGIVLDSEPSENDRAWLATLNAASTVIELYWLKGDSVFSARVAGQSLAEKATCAVGPA